MQPDIPATYDSETTYQQCTKHAEKPLNEHKPINPLGSCPPSIGLNSSLLYDKIDKVGSELMKFF